MFQLGRRVGRQGGRRALRACLLAGLVLSLAACNTNQRPEEFGAQTGLTTPGSPRDFITRAGDIVYFSTDSTELTVESQQTLVGQAKWLKQYPDNAILIEGHADERGTREYNIALGAKRAQTVRAFLVQQGISPSRMRTASYGKERPVAVCNDISCWSQNRRVQTVVNGRPDAKS
jgi:peptidoglycan-associated lipoprotein